MKRKRHKKPVLLVLMGPPGSGKNERGKIIRMMYRGRKVAVRRVVCSEVLRSLKRVNRELYETQIKPYQERGELVPDANVIDVILAHILPILKAGHHVILDGFPRTKNQALASLPLIEAARSTHEIRVLILNTAISVCRRRVLGPHGRRRKDDTPDIFDHKRVPDWKRALEGAEVLRQNGIRSETVKAGSNPAEGVYYILRKIGLL